MADDRVQIEFTQQGYRQLQRAIRDLVVPLPAAPEPPAPSAADAGFAPLINDISERRVVGFLDEAGKLRWVDETRATEAPGGWRMLYFRQP
jgi:hypothetical protein